MNGITSTLSSLWRFWESRIRHFPINKVLWFRSTIHCFSSLPIQGGNTVEESAQLVRHSFGPRCWFSGSISCRWSLHQASFRSQVVEQVGYARQPNYGLLKLIFKKQKKENLGEENVDNFWTFGLPKTGDGLVYGHGSDVNSPGRSATALTINTSCPPSGCERAGAAHRPASWDTTTETSPDASAKRPGGTG